MIPLMKNTFINEAETKADLSVFINQAKQLSMSKKCFEFEEKFSKQQMRKHSILFNSGGSANLALIQSLKNLGKIKDGDNIGFSALTWSTNVMPIMQLGFNPIPIDCEIDTMNVSSKMLEERIKEVDLKVLFITNVLGFVDDIEKIKSLCDSNDIILIEDNCESLGTETLTNKAGNFGIGASFSFFVAHHMSTIEGGMICSDDDELAEMLKIVRANGWDRNLNHQQQHKWRKKYNIKNEFEGKYSFYDLGYNLRPTEITGFLGIEQLKYLEKNIQVRETNFLRLEKKIQENDDFILLRRNHLKRVSSFAIPVITKNSALRSEYLNQFSGAGVEIRPLIAGNIQKQPFYKKYISKTFKLDNTDFLHNNAFYCGNYPELNENDLQIIESCLTKY